jgi:hypothetical protein
VAKQVESHDEVVEQELRKSSVDVDRVQMDRVVDSPQQVRREGNTIIVPVVSQGSQGTKAIRCYGRNSHHGTSAAANGAHDCDAER